VPRAAPPGRRPRLPRPGAVARWATRTRSRPGWSCADLGQPPDGAAAGEEEGLPQVLPRRATRRPERLLKPARGGAGVNLERLQRLDRGVHVGLGCTTVGLERVHELGLPSVTCAAMAPERREPW